MQALKAIQSDNLKKIKVKEVESKHTVKRF